MPARSGIETERGAIGGSPDTPDTPATPDWAAPGTEVDAAGTVPTPDSSSPNASPRAKVPPARVARSVRTMTSSARAFLSRALSWSSASASRARTSSVSACPRVTVLRCSSSSGRNTRWRDSPTTSWGTIATRVHAWSSSFWEEVMIALIARSDPEIWSARLVNRSMLARTWRRWCS